MIASAAVVALGTAAVGVITASPATADVLVGRVYSSQPHRQEGLVDTMRSLRQKGHRNVTITRSCQNFSFDKCGCCYKPRF